MITKTNDTQLRINSQLSIPTSELRFRFSRSGGPGGQNVNKVATQVELVFDLAGSPSLSQEQKRRLLQKLGGYLDKSGRLHLTSQATRSQVRNRQDVIARFRRLLAQALRVPKKRTPTRPSAAARQRRLAYKKRRSEIKRARRAPPDE